MRRGYLALSRSAVFTRLATLSSCAYAARYPLPLEEGGLVLMNAGKLSLQLNSTLVVQELLSSAIVLGFCVHLGEPLENTRRQARESLRVISCFGDEGSLNRDNRAYLYAGAWTQDLALSVCTCQGRY